MYIYIYIYIFYIFYIQSMYRIDVLAFFVPSRVRFVAKSWLRQLLILPSALCSRSLNTHAP